MKCVYTEEQLAIMVNKQVNNYWETDYTSQYKKVIPQVMKRVEESLKHSINKYFNKESGLEFKVMHSVSYTIFLYLLSNELYKCGEEDAASAVYYLNKIMHSVDWFYAIELPKIFMAEHPLGTVLGRANYSDYFFVYQGCTVGGNRKNEKLCYPTLGKNIVMYANSTILGASNIGNNVVISAGTYIKDETIPDNCIVFGASPNLIIKKRSDFDMLKFFSSVWEDIRI